MSWCFSEINVVVISQVLGSGFSAMQLDEKRHRFQYFEICHFLNLAHPQLSLNPNTKKESTVKPPNNGHPK